LVYCYISVPFFFLKMDIQHSNPLLFKESTGPGDNLTVQNHELILHEINTLEWDELILTNDSNNSTAPKEGK
jgi:hypothetical protein